MFKQINAMITILPKVMTVVALVEPIFDEKATGEVKKEAALSALRGLGLNESLIVIAEDLIDLVVSVFNAVGIFSKRDHTEGKVAQELLSVEAAMLKSQASSVERVQ